MEVKDVRGLVSKFKYGIFCDIPVPFEYLVVSQGKGVPIALQVGEIVSKVEADAFYVGCVYYGHKGGLGHLSNRSETQPKDISHGHCLGLVLIL